MEASVRKLLFALAAVVAILAAAAPVQATTYYVDGASIVGTCNNNNNGTSESTPLCTIQKGVDKAEADGDAGGDTVLVRGPHTYAEKVTVSSVDVWGPQFTIKAHGTGTPVVQGADTISSWTQQGSSNVYLASSVTWTPKQVFKAGNARLTRRNDLSYDQLPSNTFKYVAGTGLYVNVGGGSPGSVQVSRRANGFLLNANADHVKIQGFTIEKTNEKGILSNGYCPDIWDNRVLYSGHHGIHQAAGCVGVWVARNVVAYSANPDWECQDGCTITTPATGIRTENVEDATVTDNLSMYNQGSGILVYNGDDPSVGRNNVHHNHDTGIEFKSDGSGGHSGAHLSYNIAWKNDQHGYDFNDRSMANLFNNVAYANGQIADLKGHGFNFEANSYGATLTNNISVEHTAANGYNLRVDNSSKPDGPGGNWDYNSNYNIWYNANGGSPTGDICWGGTSPTSCGTVYSYVSDVDSTPNSFREDTGNEVNGIRGDPLFIDPANGDFRLAANSPAVDSAYERNPYDVDMLGIRYYNEPATSDTGTGTPSYTDRGALEAINWSFETDYSGWAASGGSSLAVVQGCGGSCSHGSSALQITGPNSTASFGVTDSADWVADVGDSYDGAMHTYRFSAYVRSASSTGTAKLAVAEYLGGQQQGATTYSAGVTLSTSWQLLTVDYTTVAERSQLDFQILDHVPQINGEVFQVDNVKIERIYP